MQDSSRETVGEIPAVNKLQISFWKAVSLKERENQCL